MVNGNSTFQFSGQTPCGHPCLLSSFLSKSNAYWLQTLSSLPSNSSAEPWSKPPSSLTAPVNSNYTSPCFSQHRQDHDPTWCGLLGPLLCSSLALCSSHFGFLPKPWTCQASSCLRAFAPQFPPSGALFPLYPCGPLHRFLQVCAQMSALVLRPLWNALYKTILSSSLGNPMPGSQSSLFILFTIF